MELIPKRIITIWLNDTETPELVKRCIKSQDVSGYEHLVITLENVETDKEYVKKCIADKQWVRACDYLRLYYLNKYGGIYFDADTELFGSPDMFLNSRMFAFKEESGYLNNGYIGSTPDHPFLKFVLNTMDRNFRFDQNVFNAGMQFFTEAYYMADKEALDLDMKIYDLSELKKIANHHAMKSWVK